MAQDVIICENCGCKRCGENPFCSNCGKLLDTSGYTNENIYRQYEQRIMRMVENLKYHPHYDILWNETLDLYAAEAEKLQSILRTGILDIDSKDKHQDSDTDDESIQNQLKHFLERCRHPEFQIAFVGTIKTGKSTLINALLGHNYASMAVTPETAALTKFRSSEKDYINVTFFSRQEWKALWESKTINADSFVNEYYELNAEKEKDNWIGRDMIHCELANEDIESQLSLWSSSKYPRHFFVKEIEVGISTLPKDFPKQVVFVDTPGLSDPVAYRSEISKQYIKKANAVFICIEAAKVNKEEMMTIQSVLSWSAYDKKKVFIVATHWDTLNDPENDWAEQRGYLVKRLTGPAFYDTNQMADANILHSAALIHNLCRDYEKQDKKSLFPLARFAMSMQINPFSLTSADIQKLDEYSNIQTINEVIQERLVKNHSRLLYADIKNEYDQILRRLCRKTEEERTEIQRQIDATGEDLSGILQAYKKKKADMEEIQKNRDQLNGVLNAVSAMTEKRIAEYREAIKKFT